MTPADTRPVLARYLDPLDVIWLSAATRLGLRVRRNPSVFAATDGAGLLELGPRETLDADDCTAQMILHELCHWITNGAHSLHELDWGCAPEGEDLWREFATLRVQCGLASRHGLRVLLAPTTQHRRYYDRVPDDPLTPLDDGEEEARIVAETAAALVRADGAPWAEALARAFVATRGVADAVGPILSDYASDIESDALPSLWAAARQTRLG